MGWWALAAADRRSHNVAGDTLPTEIITNSLLCEPEYLAA